MDLVAEAMVKEVYGGKAKGFLLDAFPMNLEQVRSEDQAEKNRIEGRVWIKMERIGIRKSEFVATTKFLY